MQPSLFLWLTTSHIPEWQKICTVCIFDGHVSHWEVWHRDCDLIWRDSLLSPFVIENIRTVTYMWATLSINNPPPTVMTMPEDSEVVSHPIDKFHTYESHCQSMTQQMTVPGVSEVSHPLISDIHASHTVSQWPNKWPCLGLVRWWVIDMKLVCECKWAFKLIVKGYFKMKENCKIHLLLSHEICRYWQM